MISKRLLIPTLVFLLAFSAIGLAREYAGVGVMTCGDLWETFSPTAIYRAYAENDNDIQKNFSFIRIGNLERQWTTPSEMYPGGHNLHLPWAQNMIMTECSSEPINTYFTDTDERTPYYCCGFWMDGIKGTVSSNADSKGGVPWADEGRHSMIYEATFPTNLGIDMTLRVRSFNCNEANINDWVAMEIQMTNTGNADYDCDGTLDKTNHKIEALSLHMDSEIIGSIQNNNKGNRAGAKWLKSRMSGYDASPDPDGNPWALNVAFGSNCDPATIDDNGWAPDEQRYVGYRHGRAVPRDIWDGSMWIAVKQGPMTGGSSAPDKKTIYDSHPIGEGPERGWYTTSNRTIGNVSARAAYGNFLCATGTWYEDGGRSWDPTTLVAVRPDPNYFDVSDTTKFTPGKPLTFVNIIKPEGERGRPNGDMKYRGTWYQNWERNFPGTPAPLIPDADTWTEGGTPPTYHNFDGDKIVAIGPFSLEVGETITAVWIEYAGYRLKGARQSIKAARWAYANDWNIPQPPPMPDMNVKAKQIESGEFKTEVVWDAKAEAADDFAGYKIYRVTAFPKEDYREFGIRYISNYHHQGAADLGATDDQLEAKFCEPMNPNWSVPASYHLDWDADVKGPWKLQAYITKDQLANYANVGDDNATYPYSWVDTSEEVKTGYTYWYYVAAFDNESGELAGVSFTSLETGRDNWNGRDGRWYGTYHYAEGGNEYPSVNIADKKFIGANFVLKPARVTKEQLLGGAKKVEVKPNPYKVQAPHDVGSEHKVQFYNLCSDTRITILDVSGQIMDVLEYEGTDPTDGSMFWDMFTKDGPEVAPGLYIWIAEYPGGQQKGYLAIQR